MSTAVYCSEKNGIIKRHYRVNYGKQATNMAEFPSQVTEIDGHPLTRLKYLTAEGEAPHY